MTWVLQSNAFLITQQCLHLWPIPLYIKGDGSRHTPLSVYQWSECNFPKALLIYTNIVKNSVIHTHTYVYIYKYTYIYNHFIQWNLMIIKPTHTNNIRSKKGILRYYIFELTYQAWYVCKFNTFWSLNYQSFEMIIYFTSIS